MRFIRQKKFKKKSTVKLSLIPVKVFFPVFLFCLLCVAEAFSSEEPFFSYKRFFINEDAVSAGKGQGLVQRDLKAFIKKFNEGLYFFSSADYPNAEKSLQAAKRLWPEYYATDFLLAMAYENIGRYKTSARYYKSYLKKLDKLRNGGYRLTGPLMISVNARGIENYNEANMYVKNRLDEYGINIDEVVPAFDPPGPLFFFMIAIPFIAGIIYLYHELSPYWRKRKRIMRTPEGFWACRNCGTYNPVLRNECEECGRLNPEK